VAPDGRWLRVNQRLCDITGYSRDELLKSTFQDITHPDDLDTNLEYVRQMLHGEGLSYSMEKRYLRKDGGLIWINLTVALVRAPSGDPDCFISVVEDISERKRTETEVRVLNTVSHAAREARDITSLLKVVMHGVCDAARWAYADSWIPTADGSVLECVAAWCDRQRSLEAFRRASEPLTFARGVGIPGRVWESGRPEWHEDITREPMAVIPRAPAAVAAGLGAALGLPVIADGQVVAVLVFFTKEPRAEDARIVATMATVASQLGTLIQRIKAEDEVRHLNAELEARVERRTAELELANKELEAFSYTISHDLRAPLRAIDGFSRIIATEYAEGLGAEASRYFDLVRANAAQMSTLIDDLLSFSRLSRQALDRRRIDHLGVVQAALADLERTEPRTAQVTVGQIAPCEADPSLLKQVWVNLLSNAVKFSAGVERPEVEAGNFERAGETVYFVRDNGVGFDMQYAGKLFGVFQRLHRAEEYPGTGVGLAIVQRVVHRHGGRVWADSAPGRGATFYFTLGMTEPDEGRRR
jgi:PAS domain S-box-containing protein